MSCFACHQIPRNTDARHDIVSAGDEKDSVQQTKVGGIVKTIRVKNNPAIEYTTGPAGFSQVGKARIKRHEKFPVIGKVVIGTVKGDLHDIGKNLVAMMLESNGLKVYNLGVDIAPEEFARQVEEKQAGILCLSALLTTTMPMMKQTSEALSAKGLREQVKVMVGGAPVTQIYADEIGADGYAPDAGSATKIAKALIL